MAGGRVLRGLWRRLQPEPPLAGLGPVGTLVEALLADAVAKQASDVHVDPAPGGTRVRLRVDGFFEDAPAPPPGMHERIVARLKVLADLVVYRRGEVQEGSIRREGGVDLRVSIIPTVAGEKATIRVLDPRARPFRLEELAFADEAQGALTRFATLRQGAVLAAGPSGSGKTTTLYALLRRIVDERGAFTNVCSVEDPVEFQIAGVHQVPVNAERGLTFARGLSALLRQDPEVILVGEVRDRETAAVAVEAGLTGHLVLSSVHAGSAAEALTRLLDLGAEPYLAVSAVKGIVAQCLVRRVCPACGAPDTPRHALLLTLGGEGGHWRRGRGCVDCRGTGFRGRIPLGEALEVDRHLAARVLAREEAAELARGLAAGRSLLDDGLARARAGETTLEEVARVAGEARP